MHIKNLDLLVCPYCESGFHIVEKINSPNRGIFGIIKCDCDEYPVFDGIIYLLKDVVKNQLAVESLRNNDLRTTFTLLLTERKKLKWIFILLFLLRQKNYTFSEVFFTRVSSLFMFIDADSKQWYQYCQHRKKRVVFKITEATANIVTSNSIVLDCCTGLGQFLEVLSKKTNADQILGLDYSFKLLYLARLFFAQEETLLICADVNHGLPIRERSVQTIFFNDCFMYLAHQKKTVIKAARIIKRTGCIVINHIHLPLKINLAPGFTISPKRISQFHRNFLIYLASDRSLFHQLSKGNDLSFTLIKDFKLKKKDRSYSMILKNPQKNNLLTTIHMLNTGVLEYKEVDFTEEEDFQFKL